MVGEAAKIALATVTSANFIPGTLVMLRSFLNHNPWFEGEIIVFHDVMSDDDLAPITSRFPQARPRQISGPLRENLRAVSERVPWLGNRILQFASLEVLGCHGYDRLIFCDSDLLFLGSVEDAVARKDQLLCCLDGAGLRGNWRSRSDFTEVPAGTETDALKDTFNSGFMIFDGAVLTTDAYDAALAMITPDRWQNDETGHTDQMIFNICFAGQQTIIPSNFNFVLKQRALLERSAGIRLEEARVVHFNGPAKPWLPAEMLRRAPGDPTLATAHQLWTACYRQVLAQDVP